LKKTPSSEDKLGFEYLLDFQTLNEIGFHLSQKFNGLTVDSLIKTKSTHLLAKIIDNCFTLLKLIPESNLDKFKDGYLDFHSTLSLIRNIIEQANNHWYLIVDQTSKEESDLKFLLFDYHDTLSLELIRKNLFLDEGTDEFLNEQKTVLQTAIETNTAFKLLDRNKQKMILKGKKSSLLTQFEIAEKRGINLEEFKSYYKLMSTSTHSSPTSLKILAFENINDSKKPNELTEGLLFMSLNYCCFFLADLIKSTSDLWGFEISNKEAKEIIEKYSWEEKLLPTPYIIYCYKLLIYKNTR
jgi:hypothetical protein